MDDGIESPAASEEGKAIGIDLGLLDFAVTSNGSKYSNRFRRRRTQSLRHSRVAGRKQSNRSSCLRMRLFNLDSSLLYFVKVWGIGGKYSN